MWLEIDFDELVAQMIDESIGSEKELDVFGEKIQKFKARIEEESFEEVFKKMLAKEIGHTKYLKK